MVRIHTVHLDLLHGNSVTALSKWFGAKFPHFRGEIRAHTLTAELVWSREGLEFHSAWNKLFYSFMITLFYLVRHLLVWQWCLHQLLKWMPRGRIEVAWQVYLFDN